MRCDRYAAGTSTSRDSREWIKDKLTDWNLSHGALWEKSGGGD